MHAWVVPALIFVAALLYSSVGHAGASGYLAVMALCGVAPTVMKPTALVLNILVGTIASVRFARAGHFSWGLFWPFAVASVPLAFVGGAIALPSTVYRPVVGLVLLYAAYRLALTSKEEGQGHTRLPLFAALMAGAGIGLLSGLTGVGGGIFLTPLLLFAGWAETKTSSGVTAPFILVNSVAGLAGLATKAQTWPEGLPIWAVAAGVGGLIGAEYGSRRLGNVALRRLLAVVLIVAGFKLILSKG